MPDSCVHIQRVWTWRKILGRAHAILLCCIDNSNQFSHITLGEIQVNIDTFYSIDINVLHYAHVVVLSVIIFHYYYQHNSTGVLYLPWGYDFGEHHFAFNSSLYSN
jgi:hypothetical protein